MKQKIRERIELINKGEVPQGYKKTDVGIFPCDWEENQLKNIFEFKNGLNKEKEAFGKGTPIVNYVDVYKNRFLTQLGLKGRVELTPNEIMNYEVKNGDMFFTRTSETLEEIGFSTVMLDECKDTVYSGFVLRARPKNTKLSKSFCKYCF